MKEIVVNSSEDMIKIWEQLAQKHKKLLLYGDLGAGKTHLVKGFAKWLWVDENIVTSPTYAIVNNYENKLLHIDMYRLKDFSELIDRWILDNIDNFDYICIEWPKRENSYVDEEWTRIKIEKIWENSRKLIIR
jgi:tRNA threonylcarbamoyladenosine biosynthesis protein TsaE